MYWLISLPGDKQHGSKSPEAIRAGREATFRKASMITQGFGSPCFKFDFETLKVGTLDALMLLSDELDKYDKHADMTLRRIMRAWTNEVVDDNETNLASALKVDIGGVEVSAEEALCSFRWQENRFPHKQDLSTLAGEIHRQICEQDDEVKDALNKYSQIRNAINAMNRKSGGNLVVKDLHGLRGTPWHTGREFYIVCTHRHRRPEPLCGSHARRVLGENRPSFHRCAEAKG